VSSAQAAGAPRLAVIGTGKMGRAVTQLAAERGWPVVAVIGRGQPISARSLAGADVAIEFTEPSAAEANVRACIAAGCPVVVGTTGWFDALPAVGGEAERAGARLLWAANFSVGVQLFVRLAAEAGRLVRGTAFDAHLVETHHSAKKDAPSGTAIVLARAAGDALGREVGVTSVRTGHVPGTHELLFDGPFEQLRLTHEARDRRVFADGALVAARWLASSRAPGVYTMQDVLSSEAAET
jgi:4-hydroxy-tetrahydrodipicolinate reductase